MSEYRWFFVLDAGAPRTVQQWLNMRNAVATKPFVSRLRQAGEAQNLPQCFININRPALDGRYYLGDVEIHDVDGATIAAYINNQLTNRGLSTSGDVGTRAARLLLAELREAGSDLGFGAAVTNLFNVTTIGAGLRDNAINEAKAWIAARVANWESEL